MLSQAPKAMAAMQIRGCSIADFDAASAEEPPAPSAMFVRLGALMVIALYFGLAAQLLVGVPH